MSASTANVGPSSQVSHATTDSLARGRARAYAHTSIKQADEGGHSGGHGTGQTGHHNRSKKVGVEWSGVTRSPGRDDQYSGYSGEGDDAMGENQLSGEEEVCYA